MANKAASARHTPAFKAAAVARIAGGETVSAVARDIGVHRRQLQRWLPPRPEARAPIPRYGPDGRIYSEAFRRSVLDRAAGRDGISMDALAAEAGITRQTLFKWRREARTPREKRVFTPAFKAAAIARVTRGEAPGRVAAAIGVNRVTFQKWLRAHRQA